MDNLVINQISVIKGQIYFSFIYSLFIFILLSNFLGMVPYSFASTSHFILTFSLSFSIVLGATILGFQTHGLKFFSFFVKKPAGCSFALISCDRLYSLFDISYAIHVYKNVRFCLLLGLLISFYFLIIEDFIFFPLAEAAGQGEDKNILLAYLPLVHYVPNRASTLNFLSNLFNKFYSTIGSQPLGASNSKDLNITSVAKRTRRVKLYENADAPLL